jgi:hypothetical protein
MHLFSVYKVNLQINFLLSNGELKNIKAGYFG